jgi:hypothetical protein
MVKYVLLRTLRPELDVTLRPELGLPFKLLLLFYFRWQVLPNEPKNMPSCIGRHFWSQLVHYYSAKLNSCCHFLKFPTCHVQCKCTFTFFGWPNNCSYTHSRGFVRRLHILRDNWIRLAKHGRQIFSRGGGGGCHFRGGPRGVKFVDPIFDWQKK